MTPRDTGPYRVYVNPSRSQANVHAVGCVRLGQRGGLQPGHPGNRHYSCVYDSFRAAWEYARAQNKTVTNAHRECLPGRDFDDFRMVRRA